VRLFGQSPAGLSSTGDSDIRNYYDSINAQQELNLRQPIDLLLSVCYRSKFGKPRPETLDFDFAPLWQMSTAEKFNMAKTAAETIEIARDSGCISDAIATKEYANISKETGLFTNITPEYITEIEN
jgi:phage-related protein (TIGR01555 family)